MPGFARVAGSDDIAEGQVKGFEVDGKAVAVARSAGRLYAFADDCTHMHCQLSPGMRPIAGVGGKLMDSRIICPCHGGAFDLETGHPTNPPTTKPIALYHVREDDGEILVSVES